MKKTLLATLLLTALGAATPSWAQSIKLAITGQIGRAHV